MLFIRFNKYLQLLYTSQIIPNVMLFIANWQKKLNVVLCDRLKGWGGMEGGVGSRGRRHTYAYSWVMFYGRSQRNIVK